MVFQSKSCFIICGIIILSVLLSGCNIKEDENKSEDNSNKVNIETKLNIKEEKGINQIGIEENMAVYEADDPTSIVYFYVTVQRGTEGSDTDHTLSEIDNTLKFKDGEPVYGEEIKAEAIVQIGDETGPKGTLFGGNITTPNATISKRGNSSSRAAQSSYKLKLDKNAGLWRGQANIALNKHAFDITRIKNKLYFDLLKDIGEVPSLRTQFARLYIKDETAGRAEFEDYGLFTQVEVPNKKYLLNHGFDASGYLYKLRAFNFEMHDAIKNFDDPAFNLEEFQKIMECKGKEDNSKLIQLIQDINNIGIDIDEIIEKNFDRDNYLTWLGYNILMGNIDTTMQNFYLYSPLNGDKWYFIPWDGDDSLTITEELMNGEIDRSKTWAKGISNYWGVSFHRRFLKIDKNRRDLEIKIEELMGILTEQKVAHLIDTYRKTIDSYVMEMPDLLHLGATKSEREMVLASIPKEIKKNYDNFRDSLDDVMPFYLGDPVIKEDSIYFEWDDAYDFQNNEVTYDLLVSANADMKQIKAEVRNIRELHTTIDRLPKGQYYWTVTATTEDGRTSIPFEVYSGYSVKFYGTERLVIP